MAQSAVSTLPPTGVTTNSANLLASVNPGGSDMAVWFEWWDSYLDNLTPAQGIGNGNQNVSVSFNLTNLALSRYYVYRGVASNDLGVLYGTNMAFITLGWPLVSTLGPSDLSSAGATLNALIVPNGFATIAWFEYGLTTNYGARTPAESLGAGTANVPLANAIGGFLQQALVHYRAVASNSLGLSYGSDATFNTLGPAGTALQFDGLTTSVSLPVMDLSYTNQLTIEAWVLPVGDFGPIISLEATNIWPMWELLFGASQTLSFFMWSEVQERLPMQGFAGGLWHHLAASCDGAHIRLYHNGVFLASGVMVGQVRGGATSLLIGLNLAGNHFNGQIDEVRIWSGARSAAEIDQGRFQRLTGVEPGLVAYWRFDEGTGTVAHDATGHGFDGKLVGNVTWVYSGVPLGIPYARTAAAGPGNLSNAVLNAWINPDNYSTTAWFEWGTDTNYGNVSAFQNLGSNSLLLPISQPLSGLSADTTYHFRATAVNTNGVIHSADQSFVLTTRDKALIFNGIDESVDLPAIDLSTGNQITLEAWVKPVGLSAGSAYDILRQEVPGFSVPWPPPAPDWLLSLSGGALVFGLSTAPINSRSSYQTLTAPINPDQLDNGLWHHVAATYDGTNTTLYQDGARIGSGTQSANLVFSAGSGAIGSMARAGGEFFQGWIDEIRVWKVARTQADILQSMNRALSGNEAGLVAYYPFHEGTGASTQDLTTNAHSGTLMNSPSWVVSDALNRPFCATLPATNYSNSSALFNAAAQPQGQQMALWFEWGQTTNYGNATPIQSVGDGLGVVYVSQPVSNLAAGTTYHCRCVASNLTALLTSLDTSFTTTGPKVTTLPPSSLSGTSMVLNGRVETPGIPTQFWFEWGTNVNYGFFTPIQNVTDFNCTAVVTNLTAGQLYHYRVMATNIGGLATGLDQPFTACFSNLLWGGPYLSQGSVAWGDYNQDGNLDLLATGTDSTNAYALLFQSDGQNMTPIFSWCCNSGIIGVKFGPGIWGDFDNDGSLDPLVAGYTSPWYNNPPIVTELYHNDTGLFVDAGTGLQGVGNSSVAGADFDNDGNLDLLITGVTNGNAWWIDPSSVTNILYRNNGDGTFTNVPAGLPAVFDGSVAWGDYDNDGQLDLVIMGNTGSNYITRIYRNNHGVFTDIGAGLPGLCCGSAAWGDFDNDGQLDLLLVGQTNSDPNSGICQVYRNDHGTFTNIGAVFPSVHNASGAWGDFDGDGQLDLVILGHDNSLPGDYYGDVGRDTVRIFHNDHGAFADIGAGLGGASSGAIAWGDFDNDGRLDIALLGGYGGVFIYRNVCPQASTNPYVPFPPKILSGTVTNNRVVLNWDTGSDPNTPAAGLSYNLRVGTTPGGVQVVSPQSDTLTGLRRLPQLGNAGSRFFATLTNLHVGRYFWSVQSINHSFAGSAWAAEQFFEVSNSPPSAVTLAPTNLLCCSVDVAGIVGPGELPTLAWFDWGTTTNLGNRSTPQNVGQGPAPVYLSQTLTGLEPTMTYFVRFAASNSLGLAIGTNQTFTTEGPAPLAWTLTSSNVDYTGALLLGASPLTNPSAQYFIEWGTTTNYGSLVSATIEDSALQFDGIDDFVAIGWGKFPDITNSFTIELWANPSAARAATDESTGGVEGVGGQQYALFPDEGAIAYGDASHAGAGISVGTNGVSVMEHTDNYLPSVLVYNASISNWTHLALVYSNHFPSLFLNGTSVHTGLASSVTIHPGADLGGATNTGYGQFQGALQEVRLWDVPLDAATIQTWMARTVTSQHPMYAHLQGYWPLNEGQGNSVSDLSPRRNNGLLMDGTSWTAGHDASALVYGSTLTGLSPGTVYHFRAVAINAGGIAYGLDQTFTTLPQPRVLGAFPQPEGAWLLKFSGTQGHDYILQASTNLIDWTLITNLVADPNGLFQFLDRGNTKVPTRFYRLKVPLGGVGP